jgi:glutathione S-transferase
MKLYGHPWSNAARRVQMLCEELGISYAYEAVDLMKGVQYESEFVKLNPNSKVPVIDDEGFVLWESQAIMRYLADKHKAETWYPKDAKKRAVVEQWLDWNQTRLGTEAGKLMFNLHFAGDQRDDRAIESARKWLLKILPVLDGVLAKRTWLCGDGIALPDLAIVTSIWYLAHCQHDLAPYPAIRRWYAAVTARPSFAKTAPRA